MANTNLGQSTSVISEGDRANLINLARSDSSFRELLRTDWPAALKKAGIDPADVKGKILQGTDFVPFAGGAS